MRLPGVCCCCGRTISREFVHCPWCGEKQLEEALSMQPKKNGRLEVSAGSEGISSGNGSAGKACCSSSGSYSDRLKSITSRITELENEFDILVMRMEKGKKC